jgi:hypothetical protein
MDGVVDVAAFRAPPGREVMLGKLPTAWRMSDPRLEPVTPPVSQ